LDAKLFTFCGTKDKRGVTTQRVSAYRVSIERLVGLNKTLRGIKLGNFQYEKEKLQLGDSKGNHFTLVIREVKPTFGVASPSSMSTLLQTCIETLSTKGFINYFGMQRFGSRQVSTHKIGACLLSGQWQEACHLILGRDEPLPLNHSNKHLPRPASSMHPLPDFFSAKTYLFENWDLKGALDLFPRYCTAERAILNSFLSQQKQNPSLTRDKWNYLQAIQSITRNLRLMYVHAYQSRVWNEMVSLRHERYGMILVPGDLVRLDDKDDSDDVQDQNEQADLNEEDQGYKRRGLYNVKALQNEDDLTQYSIYDLVLPLPGTSVIYPENMKKEYIDFMAMDGFDPLEMKRRVKDVSLPGFYRCVYALPSNVKGELKRYSDQSSKPADFILTDLDKLASHKSDISQSENDTAEGDLYAFVLEFGLASSQYATMLLREIMKSETSASFQSTLSSASKDHLK
jgi:tRNA pseudouridine13 synthase